ncbi:MAG: hypothetical protein QNJ55_04315 [Xenococcus sp. MO_188.B8]|nr:hypothetical protein [Xenococcus sp. MO_188.B8]
MPYKKANKLRQYQKILEIKQEVYRLTLTKSTKQLKKNNPLLTINKDLRRNENWISIHNTLKLVDDFQQEQTSKQLQKDFGFKLLNKESTFQDLLNHVQSIRKFVESLSERINC